MVQRQDDLLKSQRYIDLNPVHAGMVPHPRDYPRSSYRANGDLRSRADNSSYTCWRWPTAMSRMTRVLRSMA